MSQPHIAPGGYTSIALDGGGCRNQQFCIDCGIPIHTIDFARGILPLEAGTPIGDDCPGVRIRPTIGARMAKSVEKRGPGRPKKQDLPGMEDRAIKPLEDIAAAYADVRDRRIELNREEAELKQHALKLMAKYGKTIYRHDGITITVIDGEPDVKVKVKKPGDGEEKGGEDDDASSDGEGAGA